MSSNDSSTPSTSAETYCLICGSGVSFPKNPILFCDGKDCDIPVHQKCYGVKVVPEGNWFCQRCDDRIPVNNTPSCCCPQKHGAFKRSTIPNEYIHVACARHHPSLNENAELIAFDPSLAIKQVCCICKSDYGICSQCSEDGCENTMHATCAQNQSQKGVKYTILYCNEHLIKNQRQKSTAASTPSASGSIHNRSTKRSKSLRESSDEEDSDEDDYELDSDEDMEDPTVNDSEEDHWMNRSAHSSTSSKGHSRSKRSIDILERRRRELDSESEEIDVDDSEAVLGSSANSSSAQRKKAKIAKSTSRESPAESQRKRLLMTLDKSKKKQGVSALNNVNLSSLPIRTLGGIGIVSSSTAIGNNGSSTGSSVIGSEPKQKLPGISRYNSISNNSSSVAEAPSNPYSTVSGTPPSLGSVDRFQGNENIQNSVRGSNESNGMNLKGLTFNLDPSVDIQNLKGSLASSPVISSFSNSGSPIHARLADKQQQQQPQQQSPKSSTGDESVKNLQGKINNYEVQIQTMGAQIQQLQQQLANSSNTTSSPTNNLASTKNLSPLAVANPHTIGLPGQDLQYRFDELQHNHTEEKKRSSLLRQNLRDIFGVLQVPIAQTTDAATEVSLEKIDEYIQVLRDTIIGSDPTPLAGSSTRSFLDVKRRDMVVDRVIKELNQ